MTTLTRFAGGLGVGVMFGKIIGSIVAAPVRALNVPVKIAQKTAQAADEFMNGGRDNYTYRAPSRNTLDKVSEVIDDSCREAFGDD